MLSLPLALRGVILLPMERWRAQVWGVLMALALPCAGGDLRAGFSSGEDELKAQSEFVKVLSRHFESLKPVEGIEARFTELRADLDTVLSSTAQGKLEPEKLATLEREIRMHSEWSENYRTEYVRWVRLAAKGERHPELRMRHGMTYREVVIRRVTEVGLEIRHSSGTARLQYGDLPEDWQERFRWDEKEAQRSLAAEARADRETELLQRYAVERGVDPVVAREEEIVRLALAKLESSAPIVPAKLEPSEPLQLAELEMGELEPATSVGATRPKGPKKSR